MRSDDVESVRRVNRMRSPITMPVSGNEEEVRSVVTDNSSDEESETTTTPLLESPEPISMERLSPPNSVSCKWPTPWYWQLMVLIVRTFRHARRRILSILKLTQTLLLAIIWSLVWFQVPYEEERIFDRYSFVSL